MYYRNFLGHTLNSSTWCVFPIMGTTPTRNVTGSIGKQHALILADYRTKC